MWQMYPSLPTAPLTSDVVPYTLVMRWTTLMTMSPWFVPHTISLQPNFSSSELLTPLPNVLRAPSRARSPFTMLVNTAMTTDTHPQLCSWRSYSPWQEIESLTHQNLKVGPGRRAFASDRSKRKGRESVLRPTCFTPFIWAAARSQ